MTLNIKIQSKRDNIGQVPYFSSIKIGPGHFWCSFYQAFLGPYIFCCCISSDTSFTTMTAMHLTPEQLSTRVQAGCDAVSSFFQGYITRFPDRLPSELGMSDIFACAVGHTPETPDLGRSIHMVCAFASFSSRLFSTHTIQSFPHSQSFSSAIDDEDLKKENQHGADFIWEFTVDHNQVSTNYRIYFQGNLSR
jgi:hypothetical protein